MIILNLLFEFPKSSLQFNEYAVIASEEDKKKKKQTPDDKKEKTSRQTITRKIIKKNIRL